MLFSSVGSAAIICPSLVCQAPANTHCTTYCTVPQPQFSLSHCCTDLRCFSLFCSPLCLCSNAPLSRSLSTAQFVTLFRYPTDSLFHYPTVSLFHYPTVSLFHYLTVSLFHYPTVSLFHNPTVSLFHNPTVFHLIT
jgi:hypothetical protein